MIGAQTAVIGTAPLDGCVVVRRHFRRLDEYFAAAPIVVDVIGHEHPLGAVLRAFLEQVDALILKNDLAFHFAIAGGADRQRDVVEEIRADTSSHGLVSSSRQDEGHFEPLSHTIRPNADIVAISNMRTRASPRLPDPPQVTGSRHTSAARTKRNGPHGLLL
jgi:hypothetical protein